MSVLTKLFVVLLVVSSLLLSAAVVVFVNRVEDFKTQSEGAKVKLTSAVRHAQELDTVVADQRKAFETLQGQMSSKESELAGTISARDKTIQEDKAEKAKLDKEALVQTATVKSYADAVAAAEKQRDGMQTANDILRKDNEERLRMNGELNTRVTELTHKLDRTEKALSYTQEQLADRKAADATRRQGGAVSGAGGTGTAASPDMTIAPAGPINGVVRSVEVIGGKKYATISVGSADNVIKGMRFDVVDTGAGEFLGFLTVDSVQPNEAIGQVEGPRIEKIQKNVAVKTQS